VLDSKAIDGEIGNCLLLLRFALACGVSDESGKIPCSVGCANQMDLRGFNLEALDEELLPNEESRHLHADVDDGRGDERFRAELRIIRHGEIPGVYGAGEN